MIQMISLTFEALFPAPLQSPVHPVMLEDRREVQQDGLKQSVEQCALEEFPEVGRRLVIQSLKNFALYVSVQWISQVPLFHVIFPCLNQ